MEGFWLAFGLALGLAASPAPAQNGKGVQSPLSAQPTRTPVKAGVDRRDEGLIEKAARAAHAEIAAGKLAETRGSTPEIREFGRLMVEHHTRANHELEEIAIKKGVTWPARPDRGQQRDLKRLQGLSGVAFDRRYVEESAVEEHEDTVKLFRKAQKDAKDPELKAYFDRRLPAVEKHFEMARALERTLKERLAARSGSASAGSSRP